ncbi:hypothetical protein SASPL_142745 [Salvia splendens]|uniref:Uncharacterized protein n=1 Tax=Salvia splendens TaxID=180675 RepID=A0A8X8WKH0_SALSN|nr:uncharacterized protein LOC121770958 [Salvia splendens]XP_042023671.1 uncharacterized protein LOC121770958 [Salvia splendens]KAG6396592.1 hypothetical protein SASPL_142745 [Salvia splendens]
MGGENGRRLNIIIANLSDNWGEKPTSPFPIVNCERISISETKQQGNGRSPAKIAPVEPSFRLEKPPIADSSPGSIKDVACDPLVLTESPAIQVMERPKDSDPSAAPTASPNRWSLDSGDSLFSIHMENDGISKERSLSISGDIGELSLSEAYLPRISPKSGELHQSVKSSHTSPAAAKAIEKSQRDVKEDVSHQPTCDPPEASISIHTDSNLPSSKDSSVPPLMCSCSCGHWFHWSRCSSCCISCPSCCSKCYFSSSCCSCCCYKQNRQTKRTRPVSSYV